MQRVKALLTVATQTFRNWIFQSPQILPKTALFSNEGGSRKRMRYHRAMGIKEFIGSFIAFLNDVIIPFIIAIAFIVFLWNLARYFIIQNDSEDAREKAKKTALYGILAFVFILSIWGIVNLFVGDLFPRVSSLCPDSFPSSCEEGIFTPF